MAKVMLRIPCECGEPKQQILTAMIVAGAKTGRLLVHCKNCGLSVYEAEEDSIFRIQELLEKSFVE